MARKWSRAVAVGLDRVGVVAHAPPSRASRRVAGRGHAGAAGQVGAQRLARLGVRLLRQEARRSWSAGDRSTATGIGLLEPGEDPQQRRLADAVGTHDPEPGARR